MIPSVLTPEQLQAIHDGALRLLSRVGVRVDHRGAVRLLVDAGADADPETGQVRLSEKLVSDALQSCPSNVTLIGRDGSSLGLAPGNHQHYHMTGDNKMNVVDVRSGDIRRSTREDVALLTRLADALPNIDAILPMAAANDAPPELNALWSAQAVLLNTSKHVLASPVSIQEATMYTEMASLLCSGGDLKGQPILSGVAATTSPLCFDSESAAMVLHFAQAGCPSSPVPLHSLERLLRLPWPGAWR
jgi:trimethylamine--corrinoid protein Co-methyltransferase